METKKCKWCQGEITKDAKRCQHCHGDLRSWPRRHPFVLAVILFVIFVFLWPGLRDLFRFYTYSPDSADTAQENSEPKYLLEIQKVSYTKEDTGFDIAEGSVKNIGLEPMKNVVAVVQYLDKNDNFIKSAQALIEYNPILVGQSSPFKVITSDNPVITKGLVEFKFISGETIQTK